MITTRMIPIPRGWHQLVVRSILVFGWLSLLVGIFVGGLNTSLHVQMYYAHARGVTLDQVYAIFFFWCFWGAVSIGYIVSATLAKHSWRAGIIASSVFAIGHVSVFILVAMENGWF
jgi:hypothetical protein